MSISSLFLIIYLTTLLPINRTNDAMPKFTLITKESGIELYERWIVLEDGTNCREVMLTAQISATIEEVIHVLKDEKLGTQWNTQAKEYKIDYLNEGEWMSYVKYSFPFPLSDRECYLNNLLVVDGQTQTIFFNSISSNKFSNEKIIQISGLEGSWKAKSKEGGTFLEYHIVSIPDTSLPKWVVDPIIRKNLWKTIYNLRETIEKN